MPPSPSSCEHEILRQTQINTLPSIYLSLPISPTLLTRLEQAYQDLGVPEPRSPFLARDVQNLRRELEDGMSRERRLKVQNYVLGIKDQKKKAATELYLARYAGFKIQGDGRLEFGIEDEKPRGEKCGKGSGRGSCAVM